MTGEGAASWLVEGPYGPYVLAGEQNRLHKRGVLTRPRPLGAYCAIMVESGQVALHTPRGQRRPRPPVGVLLWPGDGMDVEVPAGSTWRRLSFDVVYQPRTRRGGLAQTHATDQCQPPPKEVWGVEPDPVVPEALLGRFRTMILYCTSHWWRGDLNYARSNSRLGAWLLDWVSSLTSGEGEDPPGDDLFARVDRQAVDGLESGVTVADMARMAGLSQRHFHELYCRRREESPGEFLRRQRLERAQLLLQTTDYPIRGIAERCGFATVSSFSHSFKSATGMGPTAWRRANTT